MRVGLCASPHDKASSETETTKPMEAANSLPFSNARVRPDPRIALPRKRQSLEQGIAGGHGVVPDE